MKLLENFPRTESKSKFQTAVNELVSESESIEEFIYLALDRDFKLQMSKFQEGSSPEILMVEMKNNKFPRKQEQETTVVAIPLSQIKKPAGYKALNETVHRFSDQKGILIDTSWWEKRDSRLRIREDRWDPELRMAPPGSLRELILSYLYSSIGIVSVKRDLAHIQAGVRDVVHLELVSLRNLNKKGPYFREVIHIELDRLAKLVKKRKNKGITEVAH